MKLTDQQQVDIVRLYTTTELSTRDLAAQYNCAYNTINTVLKLHGISPIKYKNQKLAIKAKGNTYKRGKKLSVESCKNIANALKGRKSPTQGKIYTEQERRNISEGVKRAIINKPTAQVSQARATGIIKIRNARTRCKNLLRRALNLTGSRKACKTYTALGYTEKELIAHIEAKFRPGMSWSHRESFHIDHIKPITLFVREGVTDPAIINALENLQPLYPHENRSKGAKYDIAIY